MIARGAATIWFLVALAASPAFAGKFVPPPLKGHVVDASGQLSASEISLLDRKLDGIRMSTTFAIVEFVTGPLGDIPIEDVAYETFNTWGVGEAGKDNGVLVVISPADRKIRIETGKGAGGAVTDLAADDVIQLTIAPKLKAGQLYEALDEAADALHALVKGDIPKGWTEAKAKRLKAAQRSKMGKPTIAIVIGILVLVAFLGIGSIVSSRIRGFAWALLSILRMFSGGSSSRRGFTGGGGGGSSGSGYSGGGGKSGGGGASGSY